MPRRTSGPSRPIRLAFVLLALLAMCAPPGRGQAQAASPLVVRLHVDAIIQPVVAQYIQDGLHQADRERAALVVIQLDTPGGLMPSTRDIFTAMLNARTPVAVYVSPSGARAASAGFFLLMASDVAAMAPGTNTGAAHPVGGGGEDIKGVMGEKIEQDAAASIRSLAGRYGRNATLAEEAVVKSRSFTADEALDAKLIDLIAPDFETLLEKLNGMTLHADAKSRTVQLTGAHVEDVEMSGRQRFLSALAHPNIAFILLVLGGLGLYFELSHPGAVLPGVVGAICLVLAAFGLSFLPVNYAGVALIALAMIFFIAEIKVISHGLLAVAGIVSLVLGSLMLFRSADPVMRVSLGLIIALAVFAALVVGLMMTLVMRTFRSPVRTGMEGLLQETGVARTPLDPRGKVFLHGELWDAVSETPVAPGQRVEVTRAEGMVLEVRPVVNHATS
jgi:membrane-bound serine protease (ClpP class)